MEGDNGYLAIHNISVAEGFLHISVKTKMNGLTKNSSIIYDKGN